VTIVRIIAMVNVRIIAMVIVRTISVVVVGGVVPCPFLGGHNFPTMFIQETTKRFNTHFSG
jgi:Cu/Ag efflux pump CusA